MRPTLHDYVIERFNERELFPRDAYDFANLTNRAPRLGDFVPCDEFGEVMDGQIESVRYQAAQDRVIFAGDWEVDTIDDNRCVIYQKEDFVITFAYNLIFVNGEPVRHIEELPREIEFKDGVI